MDFSRQRWLKILIAIVVIGAALRLAVMAKRTPYVYAGDDDQYLALGRAIAHDGQFRMPLDYNIPQMVQGGKPGDLTGYRNPVFPAFLALHFKLFGDGLLVPRLSLIALSLLTAMLMAFIGRRLGHPRVGLAAAALWAVWPPAWIGPYGPDRFLSETLACFLLVLHVWAAMRALQEGRLRWAVIAGLALGLAACTRGYLTLIIPVLAILLAVMQRKRLSIVLALSLSAALPPTYWVLRNWQVMGKATLSTQTEGLWLGNNKWARGSAHFDYYVIGVDASPQCQSIITKYPNFWQTNEVQRSEIWVREGLREFFGDLPRTAWRLWRKTAIFWGPFQIWSIGDHYRWHYPLALAMLVIPFGVWRLRREKKREELLLIAMPVLGTWLGCLMTFSMDRYRYCVEPFFVLAAVLGVAPAMAFLQRLKNRPTAPATSSTASSGNSG